MGWISTMITPAVRGGISLIGTNTFSSNYNTGLNAASLSTITANNLNAWFNGHLTGNIAVELNNSGSTGSPVVNVTGASVIEYNYSDGLGIHSKGAITTNNLNASYNGTGGNANFGFGA